MYVSYRAQGGSFQAFSIPPKAAEGLDKGLRAINEMQFLIQEAGGIGRLAEAVRAASDEQIALAQPQLAYAIKELEEAMVSQSVLMSVGDRGLITGKLLTARDVVVKSVEVIAQDAVDALAACRKAPSSVGKLRLLNDVVATLAEAVIVTGAVAEATGDERDRVNAVAALDTFATIAPQVAAFREGVGPIYVEAVQDNLAAPATALDKARAQATAAMGPLPELTDRRIGKVGMDLPARDTLFKEARRDEVKPLRKGQAARIREAVGSAMSDYHETFGTGGFTRLLRQVAVVAQWQAQRYLAYAANPESDETRARRLADGVDRDGRRRDILHKSDISYEEWLKFERNQRKGYQRDGEHAAALAFSMRGLLSDAARVLRPEAVERHMAFALDEASGALIGRFTDERPSDPAVVIYDDAGCGGHKGAVLAVRFEAAELADSIPPIENVRESRFSMACNYCSLHEALAGLGGEELDQTYFTGQSFVLDELANIPVPRKPEAVAPSGPSL